MNKQISKPNRKPSILECIKIFAKIGFLSFGGPTAQIALMHKELTVDKSWLTEAQFLSALSFCMFLPGPEAMQLATYSGWRLYGILGGLIAGILFLLPGAVLIALLASIYTSYGEITAVKAIFIGIKATVIIIVIEALLKIFEKTLKHRLHWIIAGASFFAFFLFSLPFPLIIFSAALIGAISFNTQGIRTPSSKERITFSIRKTATTIVLWLFVWFSPLAFIIIYFGNDHIFSQLGIFFSKLAVVSFGGAYSVLAYMTQEVVQNHNWLSASEMLDGLGLAETTNGPLILVNEFVGYVAAYRYEGNSSSTTALIGAFIALWATFVPCFLWIFAGAPYLDIVQKSQKLQGALNGVMAAVVGVILNISVWFSLQVFFKKVSKYEIGPLVIWKPHILTLDWTTVFLSLLSAFLLLYLKIGIGKTLLVTGGISLILFTYLF